MEFGPWLFTLFQVLAPGGCALQSSRLDLLPCLCGGGGTIFSRVHRRLVIANKLTAIAAVAGSLPNVLETRNQSATPHVFQSQPRKDPPSGVGAAVPAEGEAAGALLGISPTDGSPAGVPPGIEALAVLSVQPTPLPVPLHAPSLTVTVEAAVVSLGAPAEAPVADRAATAGPETLGQGSPQQEWRLREPKVVVGSLLLHRGTRGEQKRVFEGPCARCIDAPC